MYRSFRNKWLWYILRFCCLILTFKTQKRAKVEINYDIHCTARLTEAHFYYWCNQLGTPSFYLNFLFSYSLPLHLHIRSGLRERRIVRERLQSPSSPRRSESTKRPPPSPLLLSRRSGWARSAARRDRRLTSGPANAIATVRGIASAAGPATGRGQSREEANDGHRRPVPVAGRAGRGARRGERSGGTRRKRERGTFQSLFGFNWNLNDDQFLFTVTVMSTGCPKGMKYSFCLL